MMRSKVDFPGHHPKSLSVGEYNNQILKFFVLLLSYLFSILQEIRNRHWLQVMHVTNKSFQLEANVFKLNFILDIDLLK